MKTLDELLKYFAYYILPMTFVTIGVVVLYFNVWQYDCSRCRDTKAEPAPNMWPITEPIPYSSYQKCQSDKWI